MGNQHSSSSSSIDIDRIRPFSRNAGALGLTRNELDKRCQPSGLYGACNWDDKAIRRLIADGKIAARLKGEEYPDSSSDCPLEECPICFLSYSAVNITRCCHAVICTECFLQVRPQKEKESTCPFCNNENFSVTIGTKNKCSLGAGTISSSSSLTTTSLSTTSTSNSEASDPIISVGAKKKSTASVAPNTPPAKISRFGSELEKDERVKKFKKRSESFASTSGSSTPKKDKEIIESIAMTTEERQRLEEEVKAQHCHPLVLRLEAEAQDRRLQNDRAYRRSTSANNSRSETVTNRRPRVLRGGSARNWAQLANFLEGEEIDNMQAFERAIIRSMGARGGGGGPLGNNDNNNDDDRSSSSSSGSSSRNNIEQHEGFPLLRTLLTGQLDMNNWGTSGGSEDAVTNSTWNGGLRHYLARSSSEGDTGLDTASLMVLTEEQQISMAIAASMRDQEQQSAANEDGDEGGEDNDEIVGVDTGPSEIGESSNSDAALTANNQTLTVGVDADASEDASEDASADASADANADASADADADANAVTNTEATSEQLKHPSNGDEASTITELARVVTDSRAPNVDGITA